jgi:hypothetical protein
MGDGVGRFVDLSDRASKKNLEDRLAVTFASAMSSPVGVALYAGLFARILRGGKSFRFSLMHRGAQEDAHEFLNSVMDGVPFVARLREGAWTPQYVCRSCEAGDVSGNSEAFGELQLPIAGVGVESVQAAVHSYFAPEDLQIFDAWECPRAHCGDKRAPRKWMKVDVAPSLLLVQLKRWSWDPVVEGDVLLSKKVVPDRELDVQGFEYDLRGFVVHGLSTVSTRGHYVAYVRHDVGHQVKWWRYDDALRREAHESELLTCSAWRSYLMLYELRKDVSAVEAVDLVSGGDVSHGGSAGTGGGTGTQASGSSAGDGGCTVTGSSNAPVGAVVDLTAGVGGLPDSSGAVSGGLANQAGELSGTDGASRISDRVVGSAAPLSSVVAAKSVHEFVLEERDKRGQGKPKRQVTLRELSGVSNSLHSGAEVDVAMEGEKADELVEDGVDEGMRAEGRVAITGGSASTSVGIGNEALGLAGRDCVSGDADGGLVAGDAGLLFGPGAEAEGAEGAVARDVAWKRFTPRVVDHSSCLARTWLEGRGGQCGNKPKDDGELCSRHLKSWSHGKVTGEIPEKKLKAFLAAAG